MEEKLDIYEEWRAQQFKAWSVEKPQIVLTKEQWNNIPKNEPIVIENWFV